MANNTPSEIPECVVGSVPVLFQLRFFSFSYSCNCSVTVSYFFQFLCLFLCAFSALTLLVG